MLVVAQVIEATEAEGPGTRFAIWLQGCPLRCPGCCNPEMLPFEGGVSVEPATLAERALRAPDVEGITLLGGEPFAQAAPAAALCEAVRAAGLSVMIFTGFAKEELGLRGADAARLLAACDLLVDGPFVREQPETSRRWIGSSNQRMHFLTDRYHPDDPRLVAPNTIELRLRRGELTVNGWPALARALRSRGHST